MEEREKKRAPEIEGVAKNITAVYTSGAISIASRAENARASQPKLGKKVLDVVKGGNHVVTSRYMEPTQRRLEEQQLNDKS